jgi:hypothetical protein
LSRMSHVLPWIRVDAEYVQASIFAVT